MDNRIKQVMASVFDLNAADINDAASPETVRDWDSLKHMNLVLALEEEFGISFSPEQITEMLNYKLIKMTISELTGLK